MACKSYETNLIVKLGFLKGVFGGSKKKSLQRFVVENNSLRSCLKMISRISYYSESGRWGIRRGGQSAAVAPHQPQHGKRIFYF
jgi:hypothetical protein